MGVDDVEIFLEGQGADKPGEAVNLAHQVWPVAALEIPGIGPALFSLNVLAAGQMSAGDMGKRFLVGFRRHVGHERACYGHEADIAVPCVLAGPGHPFFHLVRNFDAGSGLQAQKIVLAALANAGHDKADFRALAGQSLGHSKTGRAESAADVRREFPTQH